MKKEIKTKKAQSAPGLLSQVLEVDGFIFTAGFIHVVPDGKMVKDSIEKKFTNLCHPEK